MTSEKGEVEEFSEGLLRRQREHEEVQEAFEREKAIKKTNVPTDDRLIKLRLRELGEPICFFGENVQDRRERLRRLLGERGETRGLPLSALAAEKERVAREEEAKRGFLTQGTEELRNARLWVLDYSMKRAQQRLKREKERRSIVQKLAEHIVLKGETTVVEETGDSEAMEDMHMELQNLKDELETVAKFSGTASQVADEAKPMRPVSGCCFSPNGERIATTSWSGTVRLWSTKTCEPVATLGKHAERALHCDFHPSATSDTSPETVYVASSGAEGRILLWGGVQRDEIKNKNVSKSVGTLSGHMDKVTRLRFHSSGRFLVSASHDLTWRLWDLETQQSLLSQEGHTDGLLDLAFHPDGALLCSVGTDTVCRVWDMRSGRSIVALKGHVKQVIGVDFAPNGYQVATGSDDHTVRIWDLRKKRCQYTVPAHTKLISSVRYEPANGSFLVTSSFDGTCKIFDGLDFTCIRTLAGHDSRVMYADISRDGQRIVSASYDRTWKLWEKSV